VHRPVRITKLVGRQLLLHRAELIARTPRLQPHPQTTRDDSRVRRYVLCMRHNATPFRFPVKTIEPMTVSTGHAANTSSVNAGLRVRDGHGSSPHLHVPSRVSIISIDSAQ
jgi:hypothetical protein